MTAGSQDRATVYAWLVLALSCGLMISDFMTRQVLSSVFSPLKAEWSLTDAQLGWLAGVIPLSVGLLAVPMSFLAEQWGRVRCVTMMAIVWSVATILGAVARNYGQLLSGRVVLGIAEAAYGCVGLAIVFGVFPQRLRSTAASIFLASNYVGLVLGASLGGLLAADYGWRAAVAAIGIAGLLPVLPYALMVRERKETQAAAPEAVRPTLRKAAASTLRQIFASRTVRFTYLANGLQYFAAGALPAWLPTYLMRSYRMPLAEAAGFTALLLLVAAAGMIACGSITDRLARGRHLPEASATVAISLASAVFLVLAFWMEAGTGQLLAIAAAMFFLTGTNGLANAMIGNLTRRPVHGSAFAVHALSINLLGLAPGPIVIGWMSDRIGLIEALRLVPLAPAAAALLFWLARRHYHSDARALAAQT